MQDVTTLIEVLNKPNLTQAFPTSPSQPKLTQPHSTLPILEQPYPTLPNQPNPAQHILSLPNSLDCKNVSGIEKVT